MYKRNTLYLMAAALIASAVTAPAAQIVIDENGNGFSDTNRLSFALQQDLGPGGLAGVLTYTLPFTGVQGDLLLNNSAEGILDVIRFNGTGTVLFYSDNIGGVDAIGDTTGPPSSFYSNLLTIMEVGPEGASFALYTPLAGQPGYNVSNPSYRFVSDGAASPLVPEPSSLVLWVTAMAGVGLAARRRLWTLRR